MKKLILAAITAFCLTSILPAGAQEMKSTTWSSFGVSFKVPADIIVEEDSEEGFILSNNTYYVNVQILEGEAMDKASMSKEIKHMADEDQLTEQSTVTKFELPHFYGVQLKGKNEGELYLYNYLMSKDESGGFFITVIFSDPKDQTPEKIIKSFILED